jgi:hypothetical protein
LYLKPYHFSIHQGAEVDLVLEDSKQQLYGIEIKSTATIDGHDFKGLKKLSELAGSKFRKGIVLYPGDQTLSCFGKNLQAIVSMRSIQCQSRFIPIVKKR